jgi:hypothetical protein
MNPVLTKEVVYNHARDTLVNQGKCILGARMLFASSSLALALLEILVHVKRDQLPDYMCTAAEVPTE